jgi:hypothetical protein
MMIASLAARELFANGAASERERQAVATIAAVKVSKEVSDDVDKLTADTARQILTHDETGAKLCGWKP